MNSLLARLSALSLFLAAGAAFAAAIAPPPATPAGATVDTIQGVQVADPYRWLENATDPKVEAWSDAQNERTRAYLDALPSEQTTKAQLTRLITATSPVLLSTRWRGGVVVFAIYSDPAKQQPMLVTIDGEADPKSRKIIARSQRARREGPYLHRLVRAVAATEGKSPSRSRRTAARTAPCMSTRWRAARRSTRRSRACNIPRQAAASPGPRTESPSGTRAIPAPDAPAADQHFNMQVYYPSPWRRSGERFAGAGDRRTGSSGYRKSSSTTATAAPRFSPRSSAATAANGRFTCSARARQPRRWRPMTTASSTPPSDPTTRSTASAAPAPRTAKSSRQARPTPAARWRMRRHRAGKPGGDPFRRRRAASCRIFRLSKDRLFVRDIVGGPNEVRVFDLGGQADRQAAAPADRVQFAKSKPLAGGDVLFDVSTYLRPRYYVRWNPATGKARETALKITSPISFADAEVTREFATSKDGTKVPVNIIEQKGDETRRLQSGTAVRLWRLWHQHDAIVSSARCAACGWTRAASMRSPTFAAAPSTASGGTRKAC